jgi:hypothetical protein
LTKLGGVAVKFISGLAVKIFEVSVTVLPGVETLPVSAPVKVNVSGVFAAIDALSQE